MTVPRSSFFPSSLARAIAARDSSNIKLTFIFNYYLLPFVYFINFFSNTNQRGLTEERLEVWVKLCQAHNCRVTGVTVLEEGDTLFFIKSLALKAKLGLTEKKQSLVTMSLQKIFVGHRWLVHVESTGCTCSTSSSSSSRKLARGSWVRFCKYLGKNLTDGWMKWTFRLWQCFYILVIMLGGSTT